MFALVVRFYLRDEEAAKGFNGVVEQTAAKIRESEPLMMRVAKRVRQLCALRSIQARQHSLLLTFCAGQVSLRLIRRVAYDVCRRKAMWPLLLCFRAVQQAVLPTSSPVLFLASKTTGLS